MVWLLCCLQYMSEIFQEILLVLILTFCQVPPTACLPMPCLTSTISARAALSLTLRAATCYTDRQVLIYSFLFGILLHYIVKRDAERVRPAALAPSTEHNPNTPFIYEARNDDCSRAQR